MLIWTIERLCADARLPRDLFGRQAAFVEGWPALRKNSCFPAGSAFREGREQPSVVLVRPETRGIEQEAIGQSQSSKLLILVGLRLRPKPPPINSVRYCDHTMAVNPQVFDDLGSRVLAGGQNESRVPSGPVIYNAAPPKLRS